MRKVHVIMVSIVVITIIVGSAWFLLKRNKIYDSSRVSENKQLASGTTSFVKNPDLSCERYAAEKETNKPTYNISDLTFSTEKEKNIFFTLDSCLAQLTDFNSNLPYKLGGNFVDRNWTAKYGNLPLCGDLLTLTYDMPDVFGINFSFENKVRMESDWSTKFSFAEGGKSIVGESLNIIFRNIDLKISFGIDSFFSEKIFDKDNQYVITQSKPRELLAEYLGSAQSFRAEYKKQISDFNNAMNNFMVSNQPKICAKWEEEDNGSIPPFCTDYREATDEEIEAEKKRILTSINAREKLFDTYYERMYEALINAFPFKQCGF